MYGCYFVYTREAHPGEHLPAHRNTEDKMAAARRLRDDVGIRRTILVDSLDGDVHTEYGLLPSMLYVLARGGFILYKSMWTTADRVAEFLERRHGSPRSPVSVPMYTEQAEFRRADRKQFDSLLKRNGPRSEAEWTRALEIWAGRARAARKPS